MPDVGSVIESGQISNQSDASDRAPADIFDQAIVGFRGGRDHHGATSELGIVEGQEQTRAAVDCLISIRSQRKRPALESRETDKDGGLVACFSPAAETALAQGSDVGGKTD